ncbi:hypothetical protein [Streptomyces tendae]
MAHPEELQVALVLLEGVGDELLLAVAHHVVVLVALGEPIVEENGLPHVGLRVPVGEGEKSL